MFKALFNRYGKRQLHALSSRVTTLAIGKGTAQDGTGSTLQLDFKDDKEFRVILTVQDDHTLSGLITTAEQVLRERKEFQSRQTHSEDKTNG